MAEAPYLEVFGHEDIRTRLARAVERGSLPQSLLLHGPRGVGKQRLALWVAAALNCSSGPPRPCGKCRSCRLVGRLEHPDVHWFFPLTRPKGSSSPERLESKLEDQRAEALQERRADPLYVEDTEGATGIYVAVVGTMRRLAYKAPAMGPLKVLIVGHAEALTPQLGSAEAANALLKLLEEPPEDTTVILTSDVPGALLPTIRSRVQAIRIPPIPADRVAQFLSEHSELSLKEARGIADACGGSIGRALELSDESWESVRAEALNLVRALLDGRPAARFAAAHSQSAFGARGAFGRILEEARGVLRDLLAASAGAEGSVLWRETTRSLIGRYGPEPGQLVRALEALERARTLAERNVNPQLIVVRLLRDGGTEVATGLQER